MIGRGRHDDQAVDAARRAPRRSTRVRAAGSSSELPANVTTERARATSSTPRWMAEKNGLETSSKIRPIVPDSAVRRGAAFRPCGCGGSRASRPLARTLTASSGATGGLPLTTRETVLRLTPASAATSFIVGRRPFGRACMARTVPGTVAERGHAGRAGLRRPDLPRSRARSAASGTTTLVGGRRPSSRANSNSPAWRPSAYGSWATTVTPGSTRSPSTTSSKPTSATSCWRPSSRRAQDARRS